MMKKLVNIYDIQKILGMRKKVLKVYTILAIPGVIGMMAVTDAMVTYASNDDDDRQVRYCYHSGFDDGSEKSYNRATHDQCGNNGNSYNGGFIGGCTSVDGMIHPNVKRLPNSQKEVTK